MIINPQCTRLHKLPERKSAAAVDRIECGLIELKFAGTDANEMLFEGYGAVFGNVDSQGDVIAKGAFKNAIREAKASGQWPAMLQQHGGWQMSADDMMPIGVWTDMSEDDTGLLLKGKLAPTVRGIEMYTLMKMQPRPAINGLSIGYVPVKWQMQTKPDQPRRTLQEVKLIEISPVTFPSNPKARIQAAKHVSGIRLAEQALRDAGFSSREAKAIVSKGFNSQPRQRDAGGLGEIAAALRQNLADLA
ncbi:HK97 family phage prohead protease [Paucibacter sp. R3-3]|uniref:HK97 family phage prohead protease n=1 Tax=Roseateles agri TaxID=3098619 RepID=A0ABU5DTG3_9BURK|nr:HK97 family phage prohead protease [Paucibacter sp. R3-3]MDY0748512.1 HK97 family phage prohead protease [Paucibacter sp. R3-3]